MTATSAFLRRLIADPLNYMKITRRYSGGLTLLVIYGYEAVSENDEFLEQGEDSLDLLANEVASGGGIWPVDVFPFLQHLPHFLPGMSFKRKAAKWRAQLEEFVDKPYEYVKNAMVRLTNRCLFCVSLTFCEEIWRLQVILHVNDVGGPGGERQARIRI